jgi:hypothetical protein
VRQGEILESELAVAAVEEGEDSKQTQQEVIIKRGLSPDQN